MAAMPLGEWTRRLGALPPKRMTASWSGSPDPTEYKLVAHSIAHNGRLPSDHQWCLGPTIDSVPSCSRPLKDKPSAALKKRRP
jgi:hypothetical protein